MVTIQIDGKNYVAGLKWFTYKDKKDALEKEQEIKENGNFAGIIKRDEVYLVYESKNKISEGDILAVGFLHLAGGYYYMLLDDRRFWVFVKGTDGGIIFDKVVNSLEEFEYNNQDLLAGFMGAGGTLSRQEIDISSYEKKKRLLEIDFNLKLDKKKKILLAVSLFLGFVMILAPYVYDAVKPKPKAPPAPPPTPVVPTTQPAPVEIKGGYLRNIDCDDINNECNYTLLGQEKVEEENLVKCDEVMERLKKFVKNNFVVWKWGEAVELKEGVIAYSFVAGSDIIPRSEIVKAFSNVGLMEFSYSKKEKETIINGVFICKGQEN